MAGCPGGDPEQAAGSRPPSAFAKAALYLFNSGKGFSLPPLPLPLPPLPPSPPPRTRSRRRSPRPPGQVSPGMLRGGGHGHTWRRPLAARGGGGCPPPAPPPRCFFANFGQRPGGGGSGGSWAGSRPRRCRGGATAGPRPVSLPPPPPRAVGAAKLSGVREGMCRAAVWGLGCGGGLGAARCWGAWSTGGAEGILRPGGTGWDPQGNGGLRGVGVPGAPGGSQRGCSVLG